MVLRAGSREICGSVSPENGPGALWDTFVTCVCKSWGSHWFRFLFGRVSAVCNLCAIGVTFGPKIVLFVPSIQKGHPEAVTPRRFIGRDLLAVDEGYPVP